MVPVWVASALATTSDGRAAPVNLTSTPPDRKAFPFTTLRDGRAAGQGELVLSQAAAREVGASVGDKLTVKVGSAQASTLRVAGIGVSPQRPEDFSASCLCGALPDEPPTRWLTTTDPFTDSVTGPDAMGRILQVRVTDSMVAQARLDANENELGWLRWAPAAIAAVAVALGVALASAMRSRFLGTVRGLEAAGAGPLAAWVVPVSSIALATLAGTVGGTIIGSALVTGLKGTLGDLSGQTWLSVVTPWQAVCVFVVAVTVAVSVAAFSLLALSQRLTFRPNSKWVTIIGGASLLTGAATMFSTQSGDFRDPRATLAGGLLLSTGLFLTLLAVTGRRRRSVRHKVASVGRSSMIAASVLVCGSVFVGTWFATYLSVVGTHTETGRMQPSGSIVVNGIRTDTARAVAQDGAAAPVSVFANFDETKSMVRVTSPRVGACARSLPENVISTVVGVCPLSDSVAPINLIAMESLPELSDGLVHADPRLISQGRVSLLTVSLDGHVLLVQDVPARPDARLTGLLPGAVLPQNSTWVRSMHLQPAGTATLLVEKAADLPASARSALRATIAQRAGYATMTEDRPGSREPSIVLATFVGIAAAIILAAMVAAVGSALATSQTRLRRLFVELGLSRADRRRAGWSNLSPVAIAALVGGAGALWSVQAVGLPLTIGNGLWALPSATALVALGYSVARYGREPATDQG